MLISKNNDFSFASSTLNTAVLLSIGEVNQNILRTTFPALKPYMLTPRQIVDTMLAQRGVATGDDVSKLRDPLSQTMTSLLDLTKHMASFLLASQRLIRSRQGETAFRYFQLFLEIVANLPSVIRAESHHLLRPIPGHPQPKRGHSVPIPGADEGPFAAQRTHSGTPFSGAANGNKQPNNQPKGKKGNKGNKTNQANQHTPRWSPHGSTLLSAATAPTTTPPPDYLPYVSANGTDHHVTHS
jgi:hypothetical protein